MNGSCSVSVGIYSGSLELNFLADLQKVWKYFWEQGSFIEQCSLPLNSLRGSPEENEDRRHKYQDHHHHNRHNIDLIWVDIVKDQRVSSVWIVQLIFFVRCAIRNGANFLHVFLRILSQTWVSARVSLSVNGAPVWDKPETKVVHLWKVFNNAIVDRVEPRGKAGIHFGTEVNYRLTPVPCVSNILQKWS